MLREKGLIKPTAKKDSYIQQNINWIQSWNSRKPNRITSIYATQCRMCRILRVRWPYSGARNCILHGLL